MVEIRESKIVYSGKIVKVRVDKIGDHVDGIREVVEHPGAVAVLPITSNNKVILIRQYRYPLNKWVMEVPAGTIEVDESPEECALRELEEETGYRAGRLEKMLTIFPSPGYSTERIHVFLASNLEKMVQNLDEDEEIVLLEMDLDEAISDLISSGEVDGKTLLALLYYKHVYRDRS
ncbi:MAG: NUDIX hydrolase [Aigarchaeota archaeon]|nr:NUDIX hydrolase [Aigarchaeota archaeon]MCX8192688.1 NUDIX hydrolase [Nitrososphaeria archaeon]MDW7987012.1 NUDIX hydrolase [Nitrososphaerota archaeon]